MNRLIFLVIIFSPIFSMAEMGFEIGSRSTGVDSRYSSSSATGLIIGASGDFRKSDYLGFRSGFLVSERKFSLNINNQNEEYSTTTLDIPISLVIYLEKSNSYVFMGPVILLKGDENSPLGDLESEKVQMAFNLGIHLKVIKQLALNLFFETYHFKSNYPIDTQNSLGATLSIVFN